MFLLIFLLPLAAMVQPSLGEDSVGNDLPKKDQEEILNLINDIRRKVEPTARNMLKMTWSDNAAESAKKWAGKCKEKASPVLERIVGATFCGEARLQANYLAPWSEVIETWHRKKSNFKYGVGAIDPKKDIYGYTQLIWYNSKEIGCSVAHCPESSFAFFYVCRYCPAGNILEIIEKPYKEGPPCGDCPNDCEDKLCTNACYLKDKRKDCRSLLNLFACDQPWVSKECQATCGCSNKIL
ncbi:cysteine-rich venom protein piscivorin-like [Hemicordylus capensis]|uniref:cysteine-rich venom protein piscivorin-like n=1 Tax=Hemicordylus capensis TaxID=884348 RepID=UPI0023021210|nr:cysteine-rich venom protein piscivorin-like [Hemicordylus capensis]